MRSSKLCRDAPVAEARLQDTDDKICDAVRLIRPTRLQSADALPGKSFKLTHPPVGFSPSRSSSTQSAVRETKKMSNSNYRWVIVAAGGVLGCVAIGGMFSLPVFLRPIAQDTGWSVTGVSSAMTIGFLAMACTSMAWGTLSDRIGPLPVVLTGSIVLPASLALASRASSLLSFQIMVGLMVGGSISAIFAPMMACVTGWFDTHRSLAVSLVSAGMGMAPLIMAPFAARLVSHHDWRTSMQVMAVVVAAVMIPVSLLVRRPQAVASRSAVPAGEGAPAPEMS